MRYAFHFFFNIRFWVGHVAVVKWFRGGVSEKIGGCRRVHEQKKRTRPTLLLKVSMRYKIRMRYVQNHDEIQYRNEIQNQNEMQNRNGEISGRTKKNGNLTKNDVYSVGIPPPPVCWDSKRKSGVSFFFFIMYPRDTRTV